MYGLWRGKKGFKDATNEEVENDIKKSLEVMIVSRLNLFQLKKTSKQMPRETLDSIFK